MDYNVKVDLLRTGTFAGTYDDISAYVTRVHWRAGMDSPRAVVSSPAIAEITLANADGAFSFDTLGSELITNGNFSSWTAGAPNSWTVVGTSANPVRAVTQVDQSEAYGGTGTGAANLYHAGGVTTLRLRQTILTVGACYRASMNITALGSTNTQGLRFEVGTSSPATSITYQTNGTKTWDFIASNTVFAVGTVASVTDATIDDVSVKQLAAYGLIRPGMLVKIATPTVIGIGFETVFYYGRIVQILPSIDAQSGQIDGRSVTLICECPMRELEHGEYLPPLKTNTTVDAALTDMFNTGLVTWPYDSSAWLVGVEGASRLDSTTVLAPDLSTYTLFDTGETTFAWLGDASDRGVGVTPLQYISDLMAAELGRFYWNPRTGKFHFDSRNSDNPLGTSLTLAGTQIISWQLSYGEALANEFEIVYLAREIGAAGTVVWSYPDLPLTLRAGDTRLLNVRYVDVNNPETYIAAMDGLAPTYGTDYTANTQEDGAGYDVSSYVTVGVEFGATGAKLSIANLYTDTVYVHLLQIRATPLTSREATVTASNGDSIRRYGRRPYDALELRVIDNADYADAVANYLLRIYSTPATFARRVSFRVTPDTANDEPCISVMIGSKVTISESWSGHNRRYVIVGEEHAIEASTRDHVVTWTLKPMDRETSWLLDDSTFGVLGTTTTLAL